MQGVNKNWSETVPAVLFLTIYASKLNIFGFWSVGLKTRHLKTSFLGPGNLWWLIIEKIICRFIDYNLFSLKLGICFQKLDKNIILGKSWNSPPSLNRWQRTMQTLKPRCCPSSERIVSFRSASNPPNIYFECWLNLILMLAPPTGWLFPWLCLQWG